MNLHIVTRLQSVGHRIYERFMHRTADDATGAVAPVDETAVTLPMMRAVLSPPPMREETDAEIARDLAAIGATQLAADQLGSMSGGRRDNDPAFELAHTWIRSLPTSLTEGGPASEAEQRPVPASGGRRAI